MAGADPAGDQVPPAAVPAEERHAGQPREHRPTGRGPGADRASSGAHERCECGGLMVGGWGTDRTVLVSGDLDEC